MLKKTVFVMAGIVILAGLALLFLPSGKCPGPSKDGTVVMADAFCLDSETVELYKKEAQQGNEVAAALLDQYYRIYRHDHKEADKWLMLGVENNFDWAIRHYGMDLCDNENTVQEGIKYLEKVCKKNYEDTCDLLKSCKEKENWSVPTSPAFKGLPSS